MFRSASLLTAVSSLQKFIHRGIVIGVLLLVTIGCTLATTEGTTPSVFVITITPEPFFAASVSDDLDTSSSMTPVPTFTQIVSESPVNSQQSMSSPTITSTTKPTTNALETPSSLVTSTATTAVVAIAPAESLKGQKLFTSPRYEEVAQRSRFSPDGRYLLTVIDENIVQVRDVETGKKVSEIPSNRDLNFSPNHQYVDAIIDGVAWVWSFPEGHEVARVPLSLGGSSSKLVFSPDGSYFATAGEFRPAGAVQVTEDMTVRVWDISSRSEIMSITFESVVTDIAFSPDSSSLVTIGSSPISPNRIDLSDNELRFWSIPSNTEIIPPERTISYDGGAELQFSPDGHFLAFSFKGPSVRVLEYPSGREIADLPHLGDDIESLFFNKDGNFLATYSATHPTNPEYAVNNVVVWELPSGKAVLSLEDTISISFSPDGQYAITETISDPFESNIQTRAWSLSTGEDITPVKYPTIIVLSPDDKYIATSGNRDISDSTTTIDIWSIASEEQVAQVGPIEDRDISSIEFSPDNSHFATKGTHIPTSYTVVQVWPWIQSGTLDELSPLTEGLLLEPTLEPATLMDVRVIDYSREPRDVFPPDTNISLGVAWRVEGAAPEDIVTVKFYFNDVLIGENSLEVEFTGAGSMERFSPQTTGSGIGRAEINYKEFTEIVTWERR